MSFVLKQAVSSRSTYHKGMARLS